MSQVLVDHICMHVQAQMDSLYGDTEKTELGHCASKFHFQIKSWNLIEEMNIQVMSFCSKISMLYKTIEGP